MAFETKFKTTKMDHNTELNIHFLIAADTMTYIFRLIAET